MPEADDARCEETAMNDRIRAAAAEPTAEYRQARGEVADR